MLEKFYLDILEDTLKKHKDFTSYKEELEAKSKTFEQCIDLLFDGNPAKEFFEADKKQPTPNKPVKPETKTTTPKEAPTPKQPAKKEAQTQDKPADTQQPTPEIPETAKHVIALSAEFSTQAVLFSYMTSGVARWYNRPETQKAFKAGAGGKRGVRLADKALLDLLKQGEGIGSTKDSKPVPYEKIYSIKLNDDNTSLQNKIAAFMFQTDQYGIKDIVDAETVPEVKQKYLDEAYKHIISLMASNLTTEATFKSFMSKFIMSHGDEAANLYKAQIKNNGIDKPEDQQNIFGLFVDHFPQAKKFESFQTGDATHATSTPYNVFQMLGEAGVLEDIMNTMHNAFAKSSASLNQKLQEAANNVFKKYQRINPPSQQIGVGQNEEVDGIIDAIAFKTNNNRRHYDKEEIYQLYIEANQKNIPFKPSNQPVASSGKVNTQIPRMTPNAIKQNVTSQKTPEPQKPMEQKPEPPKAPDTQAPEDTQAQTYKPGVFQPSQTEAMRQAVIMTFVGLMAVSLKSLQKVTKSAMAGMLEEVSYEEGLLSGIHKTVDSIAGSAAQWIKQFSGFSADFTKYNDPQAFQKIMQFIVNKSNTGSLQSLLKGFNFDQILNNFDDRIFNPEKLKDKGVQAKLKSPELLNNLESEITANLQSITTQDLQKMIETAFNANASPELRRARKIVGAVKSIGDKLKV